MFTPQTPYVSRAHRKQERRQQQKKALLDILNNFDSYLTSSDDDSIIDIQNEHSINDEEDTRCTLDDSSYTHHPNLNATAYKPDDDDIYWNENLKSLSSDSTSPLYENSHVSIKDAAIQIMSMAIECNFPKCVVERILKIFKSLLPVPNLLPITHASIIKAIGITPISLSKYYCNNCNELCTIRSQRKFCENNKCKLSNQFLRNHDISEIVTLDIKEQLKSIISRNISLFGNKELFPSFDISCSAYYKESITLTNKLTMIYGKKIYPITLNIHVDGASLVRTTKSSLWPCLASVVELPPQVREKQANIIILCLWSSSIKPDVNLFMEDCIQQLLDLAIPFTLIVNNLEFVITLKTQLFVSDLPAKALFWKTINYNGYNACTNCLTEGVYSNRQVLYPYKKNNYQQRTHDEFTATARAVEDRTSSKKKGGMINGIKGMSPLLKIFEYPKQIIFDYMHLCCLGHMSTLTQRWLTMLSREALVEINTKILSQKFPHNMSVNFNYPLNSYNEWKAKHFRVFLLSIGVPYMLSYLPSLVASHFSLYSTFVKLLHCPKSNDEIELADKIIHYYCRTAPEVYGETIELFSLHAHLHLPQQVLMHGGLCFTSAFCFESVIHYLKKKAHGTRNLVNQIADWSNITTAVERPAFQLSTPTGVNSININNSIFDKYRHDLLNVLHTFTQNENDIVLFLRYKDTFVTYHTVLYDTPYNCCSYIISYKSASTLVKYGQVIIFFKYQEHYYAFIQKYESIGKNISDYISVPKELNEKLSEIFPLRKLSTSYTFVPVIDICHKCIQIECHDYVFLSEVRVDYEHD